MFLQNDDALEIPHGNSSVWRYMSTWKFEQLLIHSTLFFPNANALSDQYEVSIPESVKNKKRDDLINDGITGNNLKGELEAFFWNTNPKKNCVFINCWSLTPHESYALWKIYLSGEANGVAVKTSVSKLKRSVINGQDNNPEPFYMGKVKYKKHLCDDSLSRLSLITTKKPFYDFEKELRLFILNDSPPEKSLDQTVNFIQGKSVKIDVNELIQEVYISPFASQGYIDEVKKLLKKYGYSKALIKKSEILDM